MEGLVLGQRYYIQGPLVRAVLARLSARMLSGSVACALTLVKDTEVLVLMRASSRPTNHG